MDAYPKVIDATILGAQENISYENGFISNTDNKVIGKIKTKEYEPFVKQGILLANKIYDQPRPITDDSFEIMDKMVDTLNSMISWI